MNNEGIEIRSVLDLEDSGYGKGIEGIGSQTVNGLGGEGDHAPPANDFSGPMNGFEWVIQFFQNHPTLCLAGSWRATKNCYVFFSFRAFDFPSISIRIFALKSSNFLAISGYLIERISQAKKAAFLVPSIPTVATGIPGGI